MLVLVEAQSSGQGVEHLDGSVDGQTLFEAGVVRGADAGQLCEFLPAQARDPAPIAVVSQADVFRAELGTAEEQEIPKLTPVLHATTIIGSPRTSLTVLGVVTPGCGTPSAASSP